MRVRGCLNTPKVRQFKQEESKAGSEMTPGLLDTSTMQDSSELLKTEENHPQNKPKLPRCRSSEVPWSSTELGSKDTQHRCSDHASDLTVSVFRRKFRFRFRFLQQFRRFRSALAGEDLAGSERLGLAPKVLQNLLGSGCEGSSAGFLLCKPFRRNLLQNPKGSEFWGGRGGRPRPVFERPFFSAHSGDLWTSSRTEHQIYASTQLAQN